MGFKGVYKAPIGTTMRVASSLDEGQTFQLRRTPSRSSCAWMLLMSMVARRAAAFARPGVDTAALAAPSFAGSSGRSSSDVQRGCAVAARTSTAVQPQTTRGRFARPKNFAFYFVGLESTLSAAGSLAARSPSARLRGVMQETAKKQSKRVYGPKSPRLRSTAECDSSAPQLVLKTSTTTARSV